MSVSVRRYLRGGGGEAEARARLGAPAVVRLAQRLEGALHLVRGRVRARVRVRVRARVSY